MITRHGYTKDQGIQPEGIAITWGKDLIAAKGGLLSFIRHFEKTMSNEDSLWLQKCRTAPKHDILYVYIIVLNRVQYRCLYGGHEKGSAEIINGNGYSWSSRQIINWPRIILAGPFEKAQNKIIRKGFQGFRYTTKLF